MKVVVDASVLAAALIDTSPIGRWAEAILATAAVCGPHLLMVETANMLRRAALAGLIEDLRASQAHQELLAFHCTLFEYELMAERVWQLRSKLTTYDASYIALAELLDCELATLDRKLAQSTDVRCTFMLPPV